MRNGLGTCGREGQTSLQLATAVHLRAGLSGAAYEAVPSAHNAAVLHVLVNVLQVFVESEMPHFKKNKFATQRS